MIPSSLDETAPFQSTLPTKGATWQQKVVIKLTNISIHAPYEGSDFKITNTTTGEWLFQSTLPVKGATWICTSGTRSS